MKPFEQAGTVRAEVILAEIAAAPVWNWLNVRKFIKDSKHAASEDIILRWQDLHGSLANQFRGLVCKDTVVAAAFPVLMSAIKSWSKGHDLGRIVIAKLPPGAEIPTHCDEGFYADWFDRYHWVIETNEEATITCQDEEQHLPLGTIWRINNHEAHSAKNQGTTPRIHVIVDALREQNWQEYTKEHTEQ
jgi:hypothetical protein